MNENILCTRIAQLRRDAGMTQEQLAARLGISFQAVSKWENNQSCPDIMLLPSLADIFDVSIDSLFGRESVETALAPQAPAQEWYDLPWPDDDGVYAVLYQGHRLVLEPEEGMDLTFTYSGPAVNVSSVMNIILAGDREIEGELSAGGNVNCRGDLSCGAVRGNVRAEGDVNCDDVCGDVSAVGDVNCDAVSGNVGAGGDVNCDNVNGNVNAGGDVDCGAVGGSVHAGGNVDCGAVGGDVSTDGDVDCDIVGGTVSAGYTPHRAQKEKVRVVWNDKELDFSELGKTINKTVREGVKSMQDALRDQFKDQ